MPNPGFESFSTCPVGFSQFTGYINNWVNPNTATPDYMNSCANPQPAGVPHNGVGWQQAHMGNGYVGMYAFSGTLYREFIQIQLTSPLTAGTVYDFHMYVVMHNRSQVALDDIGGYLSVTAPTVSGTGMLAGNPLPQVGNAPGNVITDTLNWTLVGGSYLASGGEKWLTIGHLKPDAMSTYQTLPYGNIGAYYYYEDVYLAPATLLPVELLSFSAEALSDRIHLDWATATEHNNAGFSVERSADATDFVPIGWIAGEGSSLSEQHYTYDDRDLVPGCLYYYRLRQTDLDGHSTFSGVVYASLPGQVFIATWLGNGQLALTSPDSGMLSIRVYDLTGRLREVLRMPVASGTTLLEPQATWGEVAGPGLLELDMGGHHTVVPAFP